MVKATAIVLSAGSGRRMGSDLPKQYLDLCGFPVLYYSLRAFDESIVDEIVLVVSEDYMDYVQENIVSKYSFSKKITLVKGGSERVDSVLCGLSACDSDYVLIHDGARPLVEASFINEMLSEVKTRGALVAAVPVKDTLKYTEDLVSVSHTVDRSHVMAMQTPQAFERALLSGAYRAMKEAGAGGASITDDAMLVEHYTDHPVYFSRSSYRNIKITTPEDLLIAKALLEAKN